MSLSLVYWDDDCLYLIVDFRQCAYVGLSVVLRDSLQPVPLN